jgi:sulfatase maturation enzyme AslB (radical SAM superfamily)
VDWDNLLNLFRMENLIYWVVTMVVVILTTIKQFNRQEKNNKSKNDEIMENLQKIDKQNVKMINLLEMHSKDIKSLKKDVNVLEHRVTRLEDSQVNIYRHIGGKENDNT